MKKYSSRKGVFRRFALAALAAFAGAAGLFAANVGFVEPYDDWRTAMQIAGTHVADSYYEPVSVFTTNSSVEVSFGWTRSDGSSALPPVKFSILDGSGKMLASWTEPGRATGSTAAGSANVWWSGNWKCDIIQFLEPGDYALTAELDPANTLGETASQRADNSTFFRFAIKDGALTPLDVVTGFAASSVTAVDGNDFAQAPHAVLKDYLDGAITVGNAPMMQFGPYVPMNGRVVSSRKKPLDLVFLIDISGSMGGCIRGLLNNIEIFVAQLMNGDANNDPIDDLRVKIVGFDVPRNRLTSSEYSVYSSRYPGYFIGDWFLDKGFSRDLSKLKNDLRNLKCSPWTESGLDALWYVVNEKDIGYVSSSSPFRQKGEAARAVILFTDEAPEITVLSAEGCKGKTIADLVDAVEDAEINLTVVAENFTDSLERYDQLANTNKYASAAKKSVYIRTPNLAKFSQDASSLRNLAGSVLSQVDTIVVEPMLKVETEDYGTLSFKWKNDSSAGTNNVFRFDGYNLGNRANVMTNAVLDSGTGWKEVELNVLEDGLHTFEWTYRKIGYEGDIVDCGLIADLIWEPWATQLKVTPSRMEFECEGDNSEVVTVKCNTNWVASVDASWVHLSASGRGNGTFTYTVDANAAHSSRTATITVKAGDNGRPDDVIVTRTVTVFQKESPYKENGTVQILDVGLKSRWPWNGLVDLDFRVVTPVKEVPVTVSIVGWDREGEGFRFKENKYGKACQKKPGSGDIIESWCKGVELKNVSNDLKFDCKSSGVYRITWDLSKWGEIDNSFDGTDIRVVNNRIWSPYFHTPKFCIILKGESKYEYEDKERVVSSFVTSNVVRVDTRIDNQCGGFVAMGIEKIGHPQGAIDPFSWDSSEMLDGLVSVYSLMPEKYRSKEMIDTTLCVLNDIYVEGGVIVSDTVWNADKVHLVRDNVFIKEGATLTIEDGAIVKFCAGTSIFSHYNSGSWNIIIKGAYLIDACNSKIGGDTLFGCGIADHVFDDTYRVFDTDFPDGSSDVIKYGGRPGIKGIEFNVLDSVTTNNNPFSVIYSTKPKWKRYYTYNQHFGILPRPIASGETFLGWFKGTDATPWENLETFKKPYSQLAYDLVGETDIAYAKTGVVYDRVYAISDVPDPVKYPINHWPMGNGGDAVVKLAYSATNYTATVHKPQVLSVTVNEVVIPPANYTITYSGGDFMKVGVYNVEVNFRYDYTNTAYATYAIYPTKAADATVTFSPVEYMYNGSKFTEPSVSVYAGGRYLDSDEYSIGWSAGDWTTPGTYTATVELKGNYEGTVTKTFEIKENPDLAVVMYDNDADAGDRVLDLRGKGYSPRILYLSGNDVAGNDGVATRGIIKLLKEDLDVRSFVLTNYVCRYDDYANVGSNRCETSYAPGFAGKALPFMGAVISDTDRCVAHTNGYMSATELLDFLRLAAAIPDAMLPVLSAGATDADVVALIGKMSWGDSDVAAKITTVAAYNRFRVWFERLNAATQAAVEASSRAYISSVVSEILEDAVLLGDSEKVELSITDFDLDSSTGSCCVTVELKLGGTAYQLKAAKEAFAGKIRLGATLKGMSPAAESDITAATLSGNRVKLSVKMPSGESGFVTIKID